MQTYPELGRLLKRARVGRDQAQSALAREVGVTVGFYGNVERGKRRPTAPVLMRMARALGLNYAELARAAGYTPAADSEAAITVNDPEMARWLRQMAAAFTADELRRLYEFGAEWLPGASGAADDRRRPRLRRV